MWTRGSATPPRYEDIERKARTLKPLDDPLGALSGA